MTPLYIEYLPIAIFIAFAGGLSVLFAISFMVDWKATA